MTAPYPEEVSSRRGAIATMGVLCLAGAFLIGRGFSGEPAAQAAPEPAPTMTITIGSSPEPQGAGATGRTGRRDPAGIIVGYPHSQAGAVAAAGNYLSALYVQSNRSRERETTLLTTVAAAPEDASRMQGDLGSEDDKLARALAVPNLQAVGVIAHGRVAGYRVDSYTPDAAAVDVLVAGGQGLAGVPADSPSAGRSFSEVNRMQLVWRNGDWKLQNISRLVNGGPDLGSIAAQGYAPFAIAVGEGG